MPSHVGIGVGDAVAPNATCSPSFPAGMVAGDLMLLSVTWMQWMGGTPWTAAPSGWTHLATKQGPANITQTYQGLWWKVYDGVESAPSWTAVSSPAGGYEMGYVDVWRGAVYASLYTTEAQSGTSLSHTGPTGVGAGNEVVWYINVGHGGGIGSSFANAALDSVTAVDVISTGIGSDASAGQAYGPLTASGASGAMTWSVGTSRSFASIAIVLSPGAFEPDPFGLEIGWNEVTFSVSADRMVYPGRVGLEIGWRPVAFSTTAARQVSLVGGDIETPEMTEGGDEGDVLTCHLSRPPSWADPGRWAPLMDGYGDVVTDSGTGAAIMARIT